MIETAKAVVTLPLADSGKPSSPAISHGEQPASAGWRKPLQAGLLLGLGVVVGFCLQPATLHSILKITGLETSETATPAVSEPGRGQPAIEAAALDVVALGRLVPNGGTLAVALPNGAGDARIARLLVSEGDTVQAGETIAELDNIPVLLAARFSAQANLAAQQAALDQVRASTQASLAEARANHAAAEAALTLAAQELDRQSRLVASNTTTQVLVEQARANTLRAQAERDRTAALIERYSGAASGIQSDIALAARNLELARANLVRASEDLASGRVVAPRAGAVLQIHARVGEKPSDNGVVTIGDIAQMTAELEVYQTEVKKIALGQMVDISARALPAPLTGKVERIGQIVGRQSVMSNEPAANADARVVRVTVFLDTASSERARSYTNLEVVGRIRTNAE